MHARLFAYAHIHIETERAQGRQQSDLMPDGLAERFLNSPCGKAEFAAVHLYRMMKPHEADGGYGIVTTLPIGGVRFLYADDGHSEV